MPFSRETVAQTLASGLPQSAAEITHVIRARCTPEWTCTHNDHMRVRALLRSMEAELLVQRNGRRQLSPSHGKPSGRPPEVWALTPAGFTFYQFSIDRARAILASDAVNR